MHITVTFAPCSLGFLALAQQETRFCALELGDGPDDLWSSLQKRFPKALFRTQEAKVLGSLLGELQTMIDDPRCLPDLPFSPFGTDYQKNIWSQLQKIPVGQTRTYSGLATDIGQPKATRAIASAVAANPVAILIPCHRMVGKDGTLRGFRWGLSRKAELLRREKALLPHQL